MFKSKQYNHIPVIMQDMETITINGERHYITPSGVAYPSMTTALKHLSAVDIAKWRARVGEAEATKVSNKASSRGNNIHEMCEHYINNNSIVLHEERFQFEAYTFDQLKYYLHKIDNIRGVELPLYSDTLKLAGRTDCIAEYDGVLSVIDFKTSLRPKKRDWIHNYFMQETGYSIMYEERVGERIDQLVTIIANDKSDPQVFIESRADWEKPLFAAVDAYYAARLNP